MADLAADVLASRLSALEARFEKLRKALGVGAERAGGDVRHVKVVIGDGHYALPLGCVREVLRYVRLAQVPEAPACLAGLLSIRGEVLPVVDPRSAWSDVRTVPDLGTAIVLLSDAGRTYGLLVSRVDDVIELDAASRSDLDSQVTLSPCVTSSHVYGGALVHALDPSRLLAPAHFAEVEVAFSRWEAAR